MGEIERRVRRNNRRNYQEAMRAEAERRRQADEQERVAMLHVAQQNRALHEQMLAMVAPLTQVILDALSERNYAGALLGKFPNDQGYSDVTGLPKPMGGTRPYVTATKLFRREAYWNIEYTDPQRWQWHKVVGIRLRKDGTLFIEVDEFADHWLEGRCLGRYLHPLYLTPRVYKLLHAFANSIPNIDTAKIAELEQGFDITDEMRDEMGISPKPRQLTRQGSKRR